MPETVKPLIPATDGRWWLPEMADRRAKAVTACAKQVWDQNEPSRSAALSAWRMYSDQPLVGSGTQPRLYRRRTMGTVGQTTLSLNVVKAVCDTYVSQITKDLPQVDFVTKGGDATLQRKAQKLGKFVDGIFYDADFYETLTQVCLDSALFPFGAVQVFEDYTDPNRPRVGIDRRMFWEDIADETDASSGKPGTTYTVRGMDRLAAMSRWPKLADEIFNHGMGLAEFDPGLFDDDGSGLADKIVFVDAIHRGTGEHDPGWRAIVTGDVVLEEGAFDRETTGIERLYRLKPTTGIFSQSLALELKGIQREINRLLNHLRHAMQLTSAGHWLVHQNSNFNVNALDNQQGSVFRFTGAPPQFFPGGSIPAELFAHLDRLYQRAFEIIGVSMSIAQGQTPQLNGSGKAILAYADVQSQRFKPSYRQLQHFACRVAREVIGCARRISDKHHRFAVKAPGKMMATVRWADANLEDEEFVMQPKAVNKLAEDPVGVLDQVQSFANAGPSWMLPSDGRRLMTGVPDLEAWASEMNAARDLVEQLCDRMLEDGDYIAPDPYLPLDEAKVGPDNAIRWVHLRLLKAMVDNEPSDRCDLLRKWLTEADLTVRDMQAKAAPPPQQLPPGASMGPAPPQPPPPPQAAAA